MLPEYRQDAYETWPEIMPISGSVLVGSEVDTRELERRAMLVESGIPVLGVIASDGKLCNWIDRVPVEDAISQFIPRISAAISVADSSLLTVCLSDMVSLQLDRQRVLYRTYCELMKFHEQIQRRTRAQLLYDMGITVQSGGNSPLNATEIPDGLRLVKMFEIPMLLNSWKVPDVYDLLQEKLTRRPVITSAYSDSTSMTFYGVGVCVEANRIIRSYVTDADSGATKPGSVLDLDEVDERTVQATTWNSITKLASVRNAHVLNQRGYWYPEIIVDIDRIQSVVVRPYSAWVAGSEQCRKYFPYDRDRALAAMMLSQSLGVQIEVLE